MSSLSFDFSEDFRPLAAKMRPRNLAEYVGQSHLIGEGKPLRRAIEAGHSHSMIFWGPPGTGKTTLAEIIAHHLDAEVERISAVTSGVKEIREVIEQAKLNRQAGRRTLLFVDEVHRFNKSQQDAFLPHIEDGTIIFIGATTENPSFELNNALLSRARIYILKPLQAVEILKILQMAIADTERGLGNETLVLEDDVLALLADYVNGDARFALNCLELMVDMAQDSAKGKVLNKSLLT
ncbi:TPA: AAA family ATPase, partial [Mannheimia haemolytica]|nr:AAA family ATPase [Mannheimia haemolytica]